MISSEHEEQKGFVQWFQTRYPDVLIFAIPNGGKRDITVAKKLKEEGVVPGIPDLMVPEWRLFIEMKRAKGGILSPEQEGMIAYLEECGYTVIVGRGAEDASRKILLFKERR